MTSSCFELLLIYPPMVFLFQLLQSLPLESSLFFVYLFCCLPCALNTNTLFPIFFLVLFVPTDFMFQFVLHTSFLLVFPSILLRNLIFMALILLLCLLKSCILMTSTFTFFDISLLFKKIFFKLLDTSPPFSLIFLSIFS